VTKHIHKRIRRYLRIRLRWLINCDHTGMEYSQAVDLATPVVTRGEAVQPGMRSRVLTWILPDQALTVALITILSIFFIFHGAIGLFGDSDSGWHIRNGERIIRTGLLPRVDPYSFSKAQQPWVAWEWGADVLMGAVYRLSGLAGVALMFGLAVGTAVWMWFRLNAAAGGNFLLSGLFLVPMLSATSLHWLARPHVFSWLFLLGTVWFCERMPGRLRWRHLALVVIAAAAWSNIHASFFFAPLIALVYAAGEYIGPLIWALRPFHPAGDVPQQSRGSDYIRVALAAFVGTFASPNGWRLHQHVASYLLNAGLLDRITEFQSFDFHQDGALRILVALAICCAGGFAALSIHKPARFLLSMLLIAIALRSVRALPVAALLLLPLANGSITAVLSGARGLTAGLRKRLDSTLEYGRGLSTIECSFRGYALIPLAAMLIFVSIRNGAGFPADEMPVAASAAVALLPASARILATDTFGGYLIYRFSGGRKVFFDGRSDFYGADFAERYLQMVEARPGWRAEFKRWHFTNALLPPDTPLIDALEASGWRELYRDHTAVLLSGSAGR
jgi:hypothetical protein